MIHLTETLYACSIACSAEGTAAERPVFRQHAAGERKQSTTSRGISMKSTDWPRYCRRVHRNSSEPCRPESPEVGKYVEKYFKGVDGVSTADRMRVARLIEVMTGGTALVESMHGAGSPQAQEVMYSKLANLEAKKKAALKIAGVKVED